MPPSQPAALRELPSGTRMRRRLALLHCATLATMPGLALAQAARQTTTARPARLAPQLRIVIPANPGGGWDQTGRTLGASLLQAGLAEHVDYENVGGKGGTLGLAHFADKYSNDPNALLVGGMVMVGAVALQKPRVDLSHVRPVARLTSDYLVVVVPAQSPIKSTRDLVAALRQDVKSVPIAGGSAGGVDHMFAGVLMRAAKAAPDSLVYRPHASGAEVVAALLKGDAVVGISGYSELSEALGQGMLRAIGVSSRRPVFGLPTFRDQGLDAEMANWRGVFAGKNIPTARVAEWVAALEYMAAQQPWQRALEKNRWESAWLTGADLGEFIELSLTTASVMAYLLKLKS